MPVQTEVLDRDMRRLFGSGDFEHVDYRIVQEGDQRILDIDAVEKAWGPGYVRFGMGFSYDFKGNGLFDIAATFRRTWLNSLGAEWRTDLRLGHNSRLRTGWYQPLATSHYLFVEPYAEARRTALDLYRDDLRVATYNMDRLRVGVDLGTQVTKFGEARLGLAGGTLRPKLESGPAVLDLGAPRIDQAGVALRARVRPDRQRQLPALGRVREHRGLRLAPRPGRARQLHPVGLVRAGRDPFGDEHLRRQPARRRKPRPRPSGLRPGAVGRIPAPVGSPGELADRPGAGVRPLVYAYKLVDQKLFDGVYAGFSVEGGRMSKTLFPDQAKGFVASGALFLGIDSPLGPFYLAWGRSSDGASSAYVFLGRP